jgi:hypothetical protein
MTTMDEFEYKCACCDEIHDGMPSLGSDAPLVYYLTDENEREERFHLDTDTCVFDEEHFFIKGCLEIMVHDQNEAFSFSSWVSLSKDNFEIYLQYYGESQRDHLEAMVGWYSSWLYPFESDDHLMGRIHFRNDGNRPTIELDPENDHPLSLAQRNGISKDELIQIMNYYLHNKEK